MFWACEGKTTWEISRIVEISERTVIYHLHNSAQKLGASNRQHAVAIAIGKGLITQNRMPV
jgi:LuxR family transcriptional activator of bioluminescence operon